MSRLFDALRRSQEELSPGLAPIVSAIELLGRPEKAASGFDVTPGFDAAPTFHFAADANSRLEVLTNPYSFAAEQFRVLAAHLQRLSETKATKTVLLTSASFQEGKSLVCLNLAVTLAKRSRKKVLLVEGDVRKPALARMLGLPRLTGLSECVERNEPLAEFVCRVSELDLWFLPAGASCDHPLELVQSPHIRQLLEQAREQFDWVLIDSAPLLVADASILSRLADGTLVVVRNDTTQKRALQNSLTGLEKLLGFVLNDCAGTQPSGYDQYYAYVPSNGNGHSVAATAQQSPAPATES